MNPTNLHMYALATPLIGAFAVMVAGRYSKRAVAPIVLGVLSFSFAAALTVFLQVLSGGGFRYVVGNWLAPYGIELSVDHLGSLMQVLVSGVALTASISAVKSVAHDLEDRQHLFFTLYLILIAGLHGLVLTADAFNVYVLLEIASITAYGLIALGRGRAIVSSFNYVIMGSTGACFYLLGIGYLYILTGTLNMADLARIIPTLESGAALATAFAFCIVGLWIKMAFFPLHVWLPNAYSDMPDGAAVLVAPLMTKVTIYLMIRFMFSIFSPAYEFIQHAGVQQIVVGVAALGIVCASAMAIAQTNLRRMLTYLIIAEVGYMVGGVWLANAQGHDRGDPPHRQRRADDAVPVPGRLGHRLPGGGSRLRESPGSFPAHAGDHGGLDCRGPVHDRCAAHLRVLQQVVPAPRRHRGGAVALRRCPDLQQPRECRPVLPGDRDCLLPDARCGYVRDGTRGRAGARGTGGDAAAARAGRRGADWGWPGDRAARAARNPLRRARRVLRSGIRVILKGGPSGVSI